MPIRTVILGNGGRGKVYADYIKRHPEQFELIGVADIDGSGDFTDWRDALSKRLRAELAIIALPDRLHYAAGKLALKKGMHVLLEKPIGCSWDECRGLLALVERTGKYLIPGYVLRHTDQYRKVKEILEAGTIGEVLSIHHLNAVSYPKTVQAFCRGQWSKTDESGPMILTKCSHDLDLIAWWLGDKKVLRVVSMGATKLFKPDNAPEGSAETCGKNCRADECVFRDEGEKCVYKCGADVVNYQSTLIESEDGPLVNFELEAITARRGRFTRFFGTKGTMLVDEGLVRVREFGKDEVAYEFQAETDAHGGGDDGLMQFIYEELSSGRNRAKEIVEETVRSHYLAFMAELSRRIHKVVCKL